MNLYSITIEYNVKNKDLDDTLIEQVYAKTPDEAMQKWARNIDLSGYPDIGKKIKQLLIKNLQNPDNKCVKVRDRVSMWCTTSSVRGKLFLFHLIKTETK